MNEQKITGHLMTRNWFHNILGQGVLSIAWAVLGYVGQFDVGLDRAMIESASRRAIVARVLPAVLLPLSWINRPLMVLLGVCLMAMFVMTVWAYILDINERNLLLGAAVRFRIRSAGAN